MKRLLFSVLLLPLSLLGADPIPFMLSTNSAIYGGQTNFFDINIALVTNALAAAGYSPGGAGSGTVTSVGATSTVSGLTFTGTVTDAGTLSLTGTVGLLSGGTGATNAAGARTALELGTASTNATGAFAASSHAHAGDDVTSGTVADARIASTIARDSEVAAAYEPLNSNKYQATNSVLTTLATLNGSALTNLNGSNIASGTVASARIDAAMATDAEVTAAIAANTNFPAMSIGVMNVTTNLFVADFAYGAGWDTSTNVPTRNAVYDEMELRATKANAAFTGTTTIQQNPILSVVTPATGNIVLDFQWPVLTYAVTNNVVIYQSTNRPASSTNAVFTTLLLTGDTVDRSLSWLSTWDSKVLGTNITTIPSNKVVLVSTMCIGPNESGVVLGIAKKE